MLLALLLIILATGIAWMTALTKDKKTTSQDAIVTTSAGLKCGTLAKEGDALKLKAGSSFYDIKLGAPVTLVDSCP